MKYLRAFLYSLIPVIPLLGLQLLGWGADDLRGFVSSYPRLGYVFIVAALGIANFYQAIEFPEVRNLSKGEEGKRIRRQSVLFVVMILSLFGLLFLLPFADRRSIGVMPGQILRWLGLILCALGFIVSFWARVALGRMYSAETTIQKNHHLVTTGLFRYIRHPIYLGILCFVLGLSFLFRSWIGLVATMASVTGSCFGSGMKRHYYTKSLDRSGKRTANGHGALYRISTDVLVTIIILRGHPTFSNRAGEQQWLLSPYRSVCTSTYLQQ